MNGVCFGRHNSQFDMISDELTKFISQYKCDADQHKLSGATIHEIEKGLYFLKMAEIYIRRIDHLVSGSETENRFHERLANDLLSIDY